MKDKFNSNKWAEKIAGTNEDLLLEDKILNIIIFCTFLVGLLLFIGDVIQQLGASAYFFSFFGTLAMGILYYFARKRSRSKRYIIPYSVLLVVVFAYVWYNNGGISGSSLFFMMPIAFIVPLFAKDKFRILVFVIPVALGAFFLIFEMYHPDLIVLPFSRKDLKIDMYISAVLVAATILFIMILILHSYKKEHQKVIDLNTSKDKFLSILAHDLRNPIGTLNGMGELLSAEHNKMTPMNRQDVIDSIVKSSNETYNLLENLLLWARSETGLLEVKKINFNAWAVLKETLNLLDNDLKNKKLNLTTNIEDDLILFADKNMIATIFRNLLTNAIKFTPVNGEIYISAKKLIEKKQLEFIVKDNGIGIDSKTIKILFNPSLIYSTKGTNKEKGTGLGLRICEEFVSKNEGQISVKSELNVGSEFRVTFPYKI